MQHEKTAEATAEKEAMRAMDSGNALHASFRSINGVGQNAGGVRSHGAPKTLEKQAGILLAPEHAKQCT